MSEDILDVLINIPLLLELNASDLKTVSGFFEQVELTKGQILFSEGDPGDSLYYVLSGSLIVYKDPGDAIPVEITRLKTGHFLGELAILEDSFRSATVQAANNVKLISLTKNHFYELLEKHPKIGIVLLKQLVRMVCAQLRNTTGQLAIQHGD